MNRRYAVYWAPPLWHPLWQAGCSWLGRDAARPLAVLCAAGPEALTRGPRRYGFHATLKAPMRLREPGRADDFLRDLAALAASSRAFEMPALQVARLGRFFALRPVAALLPTHPLCQLADRCVERMDGWRAESSETELARQRQGQATDPAAEARLRRWGYAHVFEGWRFHLTLSDPLPTPHGPQADALRAQAVEHFAPALAAPLRCDSLCVFVEEGPGAALRLLHRFELQG